MRRKRRPVAARVFASFAVVVVAFAAASGFCVFAQRQAVEEANLMRSGYFPLALAVRDVVAKQDTWNTQLNHSTSRQEPRRYPRLVRVRAELGRPRLLRQRAQRGLARLLWSRAAPSRSASAASCCADIDETERSVSGDGEPAGAAVRSARSPRHAASRAAARRAGHARRRGRASAWRSSKSASSRASIGWSRRRGLASAWRPGCWYR